MELVEQPLVSILIPSRNEKYLDVTLRDLLKKATGPIEIIVILDGVDAPRIDGVTYIYHPVNIGMKYAINSGAAIANGKYLMKIDAHCIVSEGFDRQLVQDHQDNWIQIPRRYKLDEEKWEPDFREWVDYEYYIFPLKYKINSLHGFRWHQRAAERKDVMIDDTLTFQGSFWFMTMEHWKRNNFMHDEGYNTLHAQEAAYLGNTTWLSGGRVVTNKNCWYSHLHKTKEGGRGYHMDLKAQRECYMYSYRHWVHDNREGFERLIEKFSPLPSWPQDWRNRLWSN
jgi:glycosyltransferase involved in cell wall biosynthesis